MDSLEFASCRNRIKADQIGKRLFDRHRQSYGVERFGCDLSSENFAIDQDTITVKDYKIYQSLNLNEGRT